MLMSTTAAEKDLAWSRLTKSVGERWTTLIVRPKDRQSAAIASAVEHVRVVGEAGQSTSRTNGFEWRGAIQPAEPFRQPAAFNALAALVTLNMRGVLAFGSKAQD